MSHPDREHIEAEIDAQQTEIEHIETQINLKDASVASECEVTHLQGAQQVHRDHIHSLEKALDDTKS